jgi:hypothetical protein
VPQVRQVPQVRPVAQVRRVPPVRSAGRARRVRAPGGPWTERRARHPTPHHRAGRCPRHRRVAGGQDPTEHGVPSHRHHPPTGRPEPTRHCRLHHRRHQAPTGRPGPGARSASCLRLRLPTGPRDRVHGRPSETLPRPPSHSRGRAAGRLPSHRHRPPPDPRSPAAPRCEAPGCPTGASGSPTTGPGVRAGREAAGPPGCRGRGPDRAPPCRTPRRSGRPGNRVRPWGRCRRWSRRRAVPTSRPQDRWDRWAFPPADSCSRLSTARAG